MLAELVWDHFQLQMLPEMKLRTKTSEKLKLLFQMYQQSWLWHGSKSNKGSYILNTISTNIQEDLTQCHCDILHYLHNDITEGIIDKVWTSDGNNDYLQKNDTYRPITGPVFIQPNLSQGYYYPDFDKMSATSL